MRTPGALALLVTTACFATNPYWDAGDGGESSGPSTADDSGGSGGSGGTGSMTATSTATASGETGVADSGSSETEELNDPTAWWDPAWSRRRALLIDGSGVEVEEFVVPVRLSSPAFAEAMPDYGDIRFVTSNHIVLPHDLERPLTKVDGTFAWVTIPRIGGLDTTKSYIYYGNPRPSDEPPSTAVWDEDFAGVWHLAGAMDESAYDNELMNLGIEFEEHCATGTCAVLGDSSPGLAATGAGLALDDLAGAEFTMSAWINPVQAGVGGAGRIIDKLVNEGTGGFALGLGDEAGVARLRFTLGTVASALTYVDETTTLELDQWHHVAATISMPGRGLRLYVDGKNTAAFALDPKTPKDSDARQPLAIGARFGVTTLSFLGMIDEVRVSSRARSDSWILAEYLATAGEMIAVGVAESYE